MFLTYRQLAEEIAKLPEEFKDLHAVVDVCHSDEHHCITLCPPEIGKIFFGKAYPLISANYGPVPDRVELEDEE